MVCRSLPGGSSRTASSASASMTSRPSGARAARALSTPDRSDKLPSGRGPAWVDDSLIRNARRARGASPVNAHTHVAMTDSPPSRRSISSPSASIHPLTSRIEPRLLIS